MSAYGETRKERLYESIRYVKDDEYVNEQDEFIADILRIVADFINLDW